MLSDADKGLIGTLHNILTNAGLGPIKKYRLSFSNAVYYDGRQVKADIYGEEVFVNVDACCRYPELEMKPALKTVRFLLIERPHEITFTLKEREAGVYDQTFIDSDRGKGLQDRLDAVGYTLKNIFTAD